MAFYSELLLSNDGGIISDYAKASQRENSATLIIGLGGTGIDCLRAVKKRVHNSLEPDNYAEIKAAQSKNLPRLPKPAFSHIKFLAIDSDKGAKDKYEGREDARASGFGRIAEEEFINIENPQIKEALRSDMIDLQETQLNEWLDYKKIDSSLVRDGAGGIRQIGRYLLFKHVTKLINNFEEKLRGAVTGIEPAPDVFIHIFSGLSGGTGSGIFLDICYLLQYLAEKNGYTTRIFGYFFLPDVNLSNPIMDGQTKAYLPLNGYAAMKELDYCMNFKNNGGKWVQKYDQALMIESAEQPVELCHLISATDASGAIRPKAYVYSLNVVSEYVLEFMIGDIQSPSSDREGTTKSMDLQGHISNVQEKLSKVMPRNGANYKYCMIGASSSQVPIKEILTYLSAMLYKAFDNMEKKQPLDSDVEKFAELNGVTYDALMNAITENIRMVVPKKDPNCPSYKRSGGGDAMLVQYRDNHKNRSLGPLEMNKSALLVPLPDDMNVAPGEIGQATSVIHRVYNGITEIITDPERGPRYAAAILRSTGVARDLRGMLAGAIAQNEGHLMDAITHEKEILQRYENDRTMLSLSAFFCTKRRNYKKLVATTKLLMQWQVKVIVYRELKSILSEIQRQVEVLAQNLTDPIAVASANLADTFEENYDYLIKLTTDDKSFLTQIISVKEIQQELNSVIKTKDVPGLKREFLQMILNRKDGWMNDPGSNIPGIVLEFFNGVFRDYSEMSIIQYLKKKYNTDDTVKLQETIYREILVRQKDRAMPLFWKNAMAADVLTVAEDSVGFCSVPGEVKAILNAAAKLEESAGIKSRHTTLLDRINILRFYVGVPMFAYQGMIQYEKLYYAAGIKIGRHIYQGKEHNGEIGRDWSRLPSPIPYSVFQFRDGLFAEEAKGRANDAGAVYERALSLGLIQSDGDQFYLALVDDGESSAIVKDARAAQEGDPFNMKDALAKIRERESLLTASVKIPIANDGAGDDSESKPRVRKDHFVSSPRLLEAAGREIKKWEERNQAIAELVRIQTYSTADSASFSDYKEALFAGVIQVNGARVFYEEGGAFAETVDLSLPSFEKGDIPLYQGYLTWMKTDEKDQARIRSRTKARLDALSLQGESLEISGATDNLRGLLTDQYMKMMQGAAQKYVNSYTDIKKKLVDISQSLVNFSTLHNLSQGGGGSL